MKLYIKLQGLLIAFLWLTYNLIKGKVNTKSRRFDKVKSIRILANGPSLSKELKEMTDNASYDYGMLNHSILTPEFEKFKPSYYFIADPLFFTRDWNSDDKARKKLFNSVSWELVLFIPIEYFDFMKSEIDNKNVTIKTFPKSLPKGFEYPVHIKNFFYKKGWASPTIQNILVGAIYASIMEGYHTIYIYGADHSWLKQISVDDNNQVCQVDKHYYDNDIIKPKPWIKPDGTPFTMSSLLNTLTYTFRSYEELVEFALHIGDIKIFNMTKESFIDSFPRGISG